jgi:hypothetical protein
MKNQRCELLIRGAITVALAFVWPLAALADPVADPPTRVGPWNGAAFAAPIIAPAVNTSYIVDNNGNKILATQLAADFFTDNDTDFAQYNQMIFTFEACHSGGFIGPLATKNGMESQINAPGNARPGIVVSTAAAWNQCSFFQGGTAANNYTDAYSYYPHYWQNQVANNGAADVQMLNAFKGASQATVAQVGGQDPQYYAASDLANTFSLRFLPSIPDYAFLFAVGGMNNVGWEFFNDIQRERNILINNYGWNPADIITMYGSGPGGTLPNGITPVPNWVDYSATNAGLIDALESVHDTTNDLSKILWFSSSHGSIVPEPSMFVMTFGGLVCLFVYSRITRRKVKTAEMKTPH